jgi:hypothetical protein
MRMLVHSTERIDHTTVAVYDIVTAVYMLMMLTFTSRCLRNALLKPSLTKRTANSLQHTDAVTDAAG